MTRVLSVRVSIEEEAFMRRTMEIAGESQLGPHIKRVYFGNLNPGEGIFPELRRNSEMALTMLAVLAKRGSPSAEVDGEKPQDRDLEFRLLCSIYLMLHMSVGRDNRAVIGRYTNHAAIEAFLNSGSNE